MSFMFEFSPRELNLLGMALVFLGSQVEADENAPEDLLTSLETIHNKLARVMELRIENENKFNEITKQLPDLLTIANDVIKEMENK